MSALLSVQDLRVEFQTRKGTVAAVHDVSFAVNPGETVAIVGESGSGKSVTAFSILRILGRNGAIRNGTVSFEGNDLSKLSVRQMREVRGKDISMIFQNPLEALNPIRKVGDQICDVLMKHLPISREEARKRALDLLEEVRIASPHERFHSYPFELSGGMCQRIMIAIAVACEPKLLIADEPTTGLDVTTQKIIMDTVRELSAVRNMSCILITHDLALASMYAQRIVVMQHGRVVEEGATYDIVHRPKEDYTKRLIAATPRQGAKVRDLLVDKNSIPPASASAPGSEEPSMRPLVEVRGLTKAYPRSGLRLSARSAGSFLAVDDVSFTISAGESVGLVGESGCGKTTISRVVARLADFTAGEVRFLGEEIGSVPPRRFARSQLRGKIQYVFQDPSSSLNPRWTAFDCIADPLLRHGGFGGAAKISERVGLLAHRAGLPTDLLSRYPHQLSGGQKARVGIARAIALDPKLLILDEPTTALDVSVQAVVLNQLDWLRKEMGLSFLFISHDLTVVSLLCERVLIMKAGKIVEEGDAASIFVSPKSDYAKTLVSSIPKLIEPRNDDLVTQ